MAHVRRSRCKVNKLPDKETTYRRYVSKPPCFFSNSMKFPNQSRRREGKRDYRKSPESWPISRTGTCRKRYGAGNPAPGCRIWRCASAPASLPVASPTRSSPPPSPSSSSRSPRRGISIASSSELRPKIPPENVCSRRRSRYFRRREKSKNVWLPTPYPSLSLSLGFGFYMRRRCWKDTRIDQQMGDWHVECGWQLCVGCRQTTRRIRGRGGPLSDHEDTWRNVVGWRVTSTMTWLWMVGLRCRVGLGELRNYESRPIEQFDSTTLKAWYTAGALKWFGPILCVGHRIMSCLLPKFRRRSRPQLGKIKTLSCMFSWFSIRPALFFFFF